LCFKPQRRNAIVFAWLPRIIKCLFALTTVFAIHPGEVSHVGFIQQCLSTLIAQLVDQPSLHPARERGGVKFLFPAGFMDADRNVFQTGVELYSGKASLGSRLLTLI
jgi:hypothetical protein